MSARDNTSAWLERAFPAFNGDRPGAAPATIRILWVVVLLGIATFAIFYCASVSRYWKLSNDSVTYVLGAQSLAAGTGYLEAGRTIFLYPPGTSAMLAAGWLAGRGSYWALHAEVVAFALGSMVICFFLLRNSMGALGAATVVLMCLASITRSTRGALFFCPTFSTYFSRCWIFGFTREARRRESVYPCWPRARCV